MKIFDDSGECLNRQIGDSLHGEADAKEHVYVSVELRVFQCV